MTLHYTLTWEEFRRAQLGGSRGKYILLTFVVFLAFAGISAAFISEHDWLWLGLTVVITAQYLSGTLWLGPKRTWSAGLGSREPRTITVNDQGIERASESLTMKFEWTRFVSVRETDDFFVLLPKRSNAPFYIPKRALDSSDDEEALRDLLRRHLASAASEKRFFVGLALLVLAVLLVTGDFVAFRLVLQK